MSFPSETCCLRHLPVRAACDRERGERAEGDEDPTNGLHRVPSFPSHASHSEDSGQTSAYRGLNVWARLGSSPRRSSWGVGDGVGGMHRVRDREELVRAVGDGAPEFVRASVLVIRRPEESEVRLVTLFRVSVTLGEVASGTTVIGQHLAARID
jgi:hypothetical protein